MSSLAENDVSFLFPLLSTNSGLRTLTCRLGPTFLRRTFFISYTLYSVLFELHEEMEPYELSLRTFTFSVFSLTEELKVTKETRIKTNNYIILIIKFDTPSEKIWTDEW